MTNNRILKAAESLARYQWDALSVLTGCKTFDNLAPQERAIRIAASRTALELAGEDILDAYLGTSRARRSDARAMAPADLALRIGELRTNSLKAMHDYDYLFPSSYVKPNRGQGEKTRRSVHGAGGDLSDGLAEHSDPVPKVTRCINAACDRLVRANDLVKGAEKALADAANAISAASPLVVDPTRITPDRETQAEIALATEAQGRRKRRSRVWQWSGEVAG